MADEPREHRAKKNIYAFLQRRSIEQRRRYLARGRRFVVLDVGHLSKSWITAVKNWLARKDRARMRSIVAYAATLAASISASYGGPCWDDISAVQAKIDAVLERKAADGPPATAEAMAGTSPQPTPRSLETANTLCCRPD
jgi:hypothetical protein